MIIEMSDADLLARLVNFEDQFVERKTVADLNDALKTVVGFANTAPVGMPCVLYIGVKDDGQFEEKEHNFDSVQKTLNRLLQKIYPRAAYFPKLLTNGSSTALAVLVPGSDLRPHFSGPSYIRRGSETIEASPSQFDALIAMRSGKVYLLMQHIGRQVTVVNMSLLGNGTFMRGNWGTVPTILECNDFWVTLQPPGDAARSFCLRDIELNFDNQRGRLQLEITTREL